MEMFSKKEVERKSPLGEQVQQMRKQRLTDNQIMQTLMREGHSSQEILDAFDLADQAAIISTHPEPITLVNPMEMRPQNIVQNQNAQRGPPPFNPQMAAQMQQPQNSFNQRPGMQMPQQPMMQQMQQQPERSKNEEEIEELIEAIIEEKWDALEKNVNKIVEWKDSVQDELIDIKEKFGIIQTNFDNLHKAIVGKIGDYDQNILNVGTQLKAMEQVFSKVLPAFTDNVNELTRITDKMKRKGPQE